MFCKKGATAREVLLKDFILARAINPAELALKVGISRFSLADIILGNKQITNYEDRRLARYFNLPAGYWLNLQKNQNSK